MSLGGKERVKFAFTEIADANEALESQSSAELVSEVIAYSGLDHGAATGLLNLPAAVMWRPLLVASFETARFLEIAKTLGRKGAFLLFPSDRFTPTLNPYKLRLAKPRVLVQAGIYRNISLCDIDRFVNKPINEITCRDGQPLYHFHETLFAKLFGECGLTYRWEKQEIESGRALYERTFALFTAICPLIETYCASSYEARFFEEVVEPAFQATVARFGRPPIIVRLLPLGGEDEVHWESLPNEALNSCLRAAGKMTKAT